jgi:5-methylcytosine-specific restriction endonuclease McrA
MSEISFNLQTKTVLDLINMYQRDQINLEPSFQRRSVWKERERAHLIDSMLRGYPIPAIFLYARTHNGRIIYDVIDGKQRLESILKFTREMRGSFPCRAQLSEGGDVEDVDWLLLRRRGLAHRIETFQISVIQVDGELGDIINLFVRINSTGRALTAQERRHAKYSSSPLLAHATKVAKRYENYFVQNGIFSPSQITRMKNIELVCELMLSAERGDPLNKKSALDRVMDAKGMTPAQIRRSEKMVIAGLNTVKRIFPSIGETRFRKASDFYSLCLLFIRYRNEGLVLIDRRTNKLAEAFLTEFSTGVDWVAEKQRLAESAGPERESYREYLLTVQQATDDIKQRRKREKILDDLLRSLFFQRSDKRIFSEVQRRIVWNSSPNKRCALCKKSLTWGTFSVDHVVAHSKGGATSISNSALLCRECNSAKGNRTVKGVAA